MSGHIQCQRDGRRADVTLCNPGKRNALDAAMWQQLAETFLAFAAGDTPHVVVLQGEGDCFAAGGDLEEFQTARATRQDAMAYHARVGEALRAIKTCPCPVIAAIRGPCVGGGLEIAAACDLRIAEDGARFGAPILKLGFSMYPEEMAMLLPLAGPALLAELLLEGRLLDSEEAAQRGLVHRCAAAGTLDIEVAATVGRVLAGAPGVARAHKFWLERLSHDRPLSEEEKSAAFDFLDSDDYREGLTAFLQKRPPRFTGR